MRCVLHNGRHIVVRTRFIVDCRQPIIWATLSNRGSIRSPDFTISTYAVSCATSHGLCTKSVQVSDSPLKTRNCGNSDCGSSTMTISQLPTCQTCLARRVREQQLVIVYYYAIKIPHRENFPRNREVKGRKSTS